MVDLHDRSAFQRVCLFEGLGQGELDAVADARQRVLTLIRGAKAGMIAPRADVDAGVRMYIERLRDQIAFEEHAVFPLISRLFDRRDWTDIAHRSAVVRCTA